MSEAAVPIQVRVTRAALSIQDCPRELADALQYTRYDIKHEHGSFVRTPVPTLYGVYDEHNRVCRSYANALHLVRHHAQAQQRVLSVNDQRVLPELSVEGLDRERYRSVCLGALSDVAKARASGVIVFPTGAGRISLICGLVQMLPNHFKVLVTTEDRSAVLQIHKALQEVVPGELMGMHCKPDSVPARIMVAKLEDLQDFTEGELAYSNYALRDFDVWICDEVHRLPVPARAKFLAQFRAVYAWGLTATPERADNSHMLNEVVFGPTLYSGREKTGPKRVAPVKALVFPLTTETPLPEGLPLSTQIELAYLNNPRLRSLLILILATLPNLDEAKIMVLVETAPDGSYDRQQLPGFTLLQGNDSLEQRRRVMEQLRAGEVAKLICPHSWADGVDISGLDYLIDCSSTVTPRKASHYIMFLNLASEKLFNQGIAKLQAIEASGWDARYMFGRELARNLDFARAGLLAELGQFTA